jgi:hypothetical protein
MLKITHNRRDGSTRSTDYARDYLKREAQYLAKHAADSDGKLRGWYVSIFETDGAGLSAIALAADYLDKNGNPRTAFMAL